MCTRELKMQVQICNNNNDSNNENLHTFVYVRKIKRHMQYIVVAAVFFSSLDVTMNFLSSTCDVIRTRSDSNRIDRMSSLFLLLTSSSLVFPFYMKGACALDMPEKNLNTYNDARNHV